MVLLRPLEVFRRDSTAVDESKFFVRKDPVESVSLVGYFPESEVSGTVETSRRSSGPVSFPSWTTPPSILRPPFQRPPPDLHFPDLVRRPLHLPQRLPRERDMSTSLSLGLSPLERVQ